jgi:hypothetical protein
MGRKHLFVSHLPETPDEDLCHCQNSDVTLKLICIYSNSPLFCVECNREYDLPPKFGQGLMRDHSG